MWSLNSIIKSLQNKKIHLLIVILSGIPCCSPIAYADAVQIVKGVNYEPQHTLDFSKAVGLDDKSAMETAILADLDKLKELQSYIAPDGKIAFKGINHIKTFDPFYESAGIYHTPVRVNLADVVDHWNKKNLPENHITMALGVWEYQTWDGCGNNLTCLQWTKAEVDAVVDAANTYGPDLIDRIIVGNEDVHQCMDSDSQNKPCSDIRSRIINDIKDIKARVKFSTDHMIQDGKIIKVGTAQLSSIVPDMLDSNHPEYAPVKNAADFIGTNVYPYWAKFSLKPFDNSPAKNNFLDYWEHQVQARVHYGDEVIVTEEGWPSEDALPDSKASAIDARDYLFYWYTRDTSNNVVTPVSYFFALFDKLPGINDPAVQAESHWGIYSADRNASVLDGNPKTLATNHIFVNFVNQIITSDITSKYHKTAVFTCLDDWNPNGSQGLCYPIYGFIKFRDTSSIIDAKDDAHGWANKKKFMLDTSGTLYKSLLIKVYDDNDDLNAYCHINFDTLKNLTSHSTITLNKVNADFSCGGISG